MDEEAPKPKATKVFPSAPDVLPPKAQLTVKQCCKELGIKEWDHLIIGDGSGSTWDHAIGWASVTITRATDRYKIRWGGMDTGTVNFAEIMAYLQPLTFLQSEAENKRERTGGRRSAQIIHIITDSQYCQLTGDSRSRMISANKNGGLWRCFDVFQRQGFVLHWHWMARERSNLNSYVDKLSKLARELVKGYNIRERMQQDGHKLKSG